MRRDTSRTVFLIAISSLVAIAAPAASGPALAAPAQVAAGQVDDALANVKRAERNGDWKAAESQLVDLLGKAPKNAGVLGEYGKLCLRTGRPQAALDYLHRAADAEPGNWAVLAALGVAYDQVGDYTNAQRAYATAIGMQPANPDLLSDSALSHARSGDAKTAAVLLKKAEEYGASREQVAQVNAAIGKAGAAKPAVQVPASPPVSMAKAAPQPAPSGMENYMVHAGAFSRRENAEAAASRLSALSARIVRVVRDGQEVSIVEFGPYRSAEAAQRAIVRAKTLGASAFIVLKINEQTAQKRAP